MFRRMILTALMATGLIAGLTVTPANADAHPPAVRYLHPEGYRHDERYRHIERIYPRFEVEVMRPGGWECYGSYRDRCEAERIADHLRCEGRMVEIRG
jgi:hypothetical protein